MNIYYTNDQNQQLIPLSFDLSKKTIRLKTQDDALPFAITKKTYVDWFKIITHKKSLATLKECF